MSHAGNSHRKPCCGCARHRLTLACFAYPHKLSMPSLFQCIYIYMCRYSLMPCSRHCCAAASDASHALIVVSLGFDVLGRCQVGSTGSRPCVARMMMAHGCLQSCARWRPKPLRQQQSAQRAGSAAGAPAEQGPAPGEESLSPVPELMSGSLCEGHVNEHGSTSTSDIMDAAAQMASCNQRCFGAQAQHAGTP